MIRQGGRLAVLGLVLLTAVPGGAADGPSESDPLETMAATDPAAAADGFDERGIRLFEASDGRAEEVANAERAFRRALALRERAFGAQHAETAKSWSTLSTFAFLLGRWDEAEAHERRALAIRRGALPAGDPAILDSLDGLGSILLRAGRLPEARSLLEESVAIRRAARPPDPAKLGEASNALAEVYRQQDDVARAEATFREALAWSEGPGREHDALRARLENNLAGLLKDEGRYGDAEELLRDSLRRREGAPAPDAADLSVGLLNLAEIHRLQGNAEGAEPLYLRSLALAREALGKDNPDLATHLAQLGVLYRGGGRLDAARPLLAEATALLERTVPPDHPLLAQALHDEGVLDALAGRVERAIEKLARALAIREGVFGPSHFETAATMVELARARAPQGAEGRGGSKGLLDRALAILDATPAYPEIAIDARAQRAALRRAEGDLTGAAADLEEAARSVESLRPGIGGGEATRAAFLAKHAGVHADLTDLLLARGQIDEAFAVAERARGRTLLDQLASAGVDLRAGIPAERRRELAARERAALARFARVREEASSLPFREDLEGTERASRQEETRRALVEAARAAREIHEEIRNASASWRGASGGSPLSLAQAQADLAGAEELLLVYQVGDRACWLIVVPPAPERGAAWRLEVSPDAGASLGISPGPLTAEALARVLTGPAGVLDEIARPPVEGFPDTSTPALASLFEILVPAPVRERLTHAAGAIVVPDGPLFALPFEALVVRTGASGPRYWLDEGPPLRYGVSATVLHALAARAGGAPRGLVTVADPAYALAGPTRWAPLAGARRESEAIAGAVRRADPSVAIAALRGEEAREPRVRAALSGRRWIHVAAHGVIDAGRGNLFAALALTPPPAGRPDPGDDGLLQLFEIYDLDLRSELAVLSACATSVGARVAGEGVFTLSRAFLASGARRVVASAWEVDDASTATLIASFFERIARAEGEGRKPDYARALAEAKRSVRAEPATASPFHWAPFVLAGLR